MSKQEKRPRVLVVWDRPGDFNDLLASRFPGIDFKYAASVADVDAILETTDPEIVFSIKHDRFPIECHRLAAAHPGVKWLQVGGSGYDHLASVDTSGLVMTNAAGVLAPYLAETVIGVMLAWNGGLYRYRDQQFETTWRAMPFTPLRDQTLLVVGAGAIGRRVAVNARALGMQVLGTSRRGDPVAEIDSMHPLSALNRVLPEADYVSLHVRLTDDTRGLVDRAAIAAMKPGAFLINTARGAVVDTDALLEGLRGGPLSGAYLDVFDEEPLPASHPLWAMRNVVITPHAADSVKDWPRRFALFFADNLDRWLEDEPLVNRV